MKSDIVSREFEFEELVREILRVCGYFVDNHVEKYKNYDVYARKDRQEFCIECKTTLQGALSFLRKYSEEKNVNVLCVPFKGEIEKFFLTAWNCDTRKYSSMQIWDISDLQEILEDVFKWENSENIQLVFNKLNKFSNKFYNINLVSDVINSTNPDRLRYWYTSIIESRKKNRWREFEKFAQKFIEYYFQGLIGQLWTQKITDENLCRYDFVAPMAIEKTDSYFMEIIRNCFNTRYLVFEAKCYTSKITQDEIWRTSKYLYKTALRNVAIILSTAPCDAHARLMQKSLLREQGKLILVLTSKNIKELLNAKDNRIDIVLKEKLDDLMIPLNA